MPKTIICPKCGEEIPSPYHLGRRRYNIPFQNVLEAYQLCKNNYAKTARYLSKKYKISVSPGFVHARIREGGVNENK